MPAQPLRRVAEFAPFEVTAALALAVRQQPRIASLCGGADFLLDEEPDLLPDEENALGAGLALDDLGSVAGGRPSGVATERTDAFTEMMSAAMWFLNDWETEE